MTDNILVTGSDGFIGSHLTEELVNSGYRVRAFVFYNSSNSWGWIDTLPVRIKKELEIFPGDIRDPHQVRKAVKDVNVLFHLAALIAIPYSYESPDSYVDTNIKGTINILQAAKEEKVKRILIASSSEVYGTAQYVPIDEIHPLHAQSPYAASKISAEKLAESYFKSFSLPISVVRPFNTFGPRQSARAIIPTIIIQLLNGNTNIKLGSLNPVRDFTYVKDTVNGFIKIAESEKTIGEEINIASQKGISIGQLADELIMQINPSAIISVDENRIRPINSEVNRLIGSYKKLTQLTDWTPQYSFERGISETIEWMRENLHRYKAEIYNK